MKPDEKYNDDLEYLSEQGFEKVAVTDSDLADLTRKVRAKTFSRNRFYLSLGSLLMGIIIGAGLLYLFNRKPLDASHLQKEDLSVLSQLSDSVNTETVITLDTLEIVKENFINPTVKRKENEIVKKQNSVSTIDSVDVIVSKPLDLSLLNQNEVKEEKLKYMINSPVFYLHDMKITNYTTLYFKKNRFVKFTGLQAVYSSTNETAPAGSRLKQAPDYYLHEEISTAMLYFKKGKYDQAINSLKTVSEYNDDDLNCDFYMAMSYYYKKNYSKAIGLFENCITNSNNTFLQEATYYKALALYENGSKEEAKILFREIAGQNEFYSAKAKTYLQE